MKSHFNTCFCTFPALMPSKGKPFPFPFAYRKAEEPCILSKTGYPIPFTLPYSGTPYPPPYVPSYVPSTDAHPRCIRPHQAGQRWKHTTFPCKNTKDTLNGVFRSTVSPSSYAQSGVLYNNSLLRPYCDHTVPHRSCICPSGFFSYNGGADNLSRYSA